MFLAASVWFQLINLSIALVAETQFECDKMPINSIPNLSSFGLSPENSGFDDDDSEFV